MADVMSEDLSNTIAVIGAGAAGCVLVNRLLDLTAKHANPPTIWLIERGGEAVDGMTAANDLLKFTSGLDIYGTTQDSAKQQGLRGRYTGVSYGSGIGGSTLLNAGAFVVGKPSDYDFLPRKDVERALEAVVAQHKPKECKPLPSFGPEGSPFQAICQGLEQKFQLENKNKSTLFLKEDGIYNTLGSIEKFDNDTAYRRSAADSFLTEQVRNNPRLKIVTDLTVTKLLFDKNKSVCGFQAKQRSTVRLPVLGYRFNYSSKEVTKVGYKKIILSTGAVESPRLLMVSGIGPKATLEQCKIDVVADNAQVGQNLIDHPVIFWPIQKNASAPTPEGFPVPGPAGCSVLGFKTIKGKTFNFYAAGPACVHYMHAEFMIPKFTVPDTWSRAMQVRMLDTMRPLIHSRSNTKLGLVGFGLLSCTPRNGQVTLDPKTQRAVVDPAYLSSPDDARALADVAADMLAVIRRSNMSVPIPNFDMEPKDMETVCRVMAGPNWHYMGTCALGKVLDTTDFSVKGVSNLHVVDASVFPNNMNANTQAPTMIVAYLAAEKIAESLV